MVVDEATRKARVLIEALPFIKRFHHQIIVVKLSGAPIEDPEILDGFLTDLVWLEQVGMRPILVHGAGKSINKAMTDAGLTPVFHQGRRVTDAATMAIVAREVERLNALLVDRLFALGGAAIGLCPPRQALVKGDLAEPALGLVGAPTSIDRELLLRCASRGLITVVPPLSVGPDGQVLNTNADDIALAVARGVHAEKLVFCSNIPGVLRDAQDPASLISSLTDVQARALIAEGVITGGMIPKIESCLGALDAGVRKIHIVDAGQPHTLLLEIFTAEGVGTELRLARTPD